jgi:hypothetical protein
VTVGQIFVSVIFGEYQVNTLIIVLRYHRMSTGTDNSSFSQRGNLIRQIRFCGDVTETFFFYLPHFQLNLDIHSMHFAAFITICINVIFAHISPQKKEAAIVLQ